jgi:hypothetical protein
MRLSALAVLALLAGPVAAHASATELDTFVAEVGAAARGLSDGTLQPDRDVDVPDLTNQIRGWKEQFREGSAEWKRVDKAQKALEDGYEASQNRAAASVRPGPGPSALPPEKVNELAVQISPLIMWYQIAAFCAEGDGTFTQDEVKSYGDKLRDGFDKNNLPKEVRDTAWRLTSISMEQIGFRHQSAARIRRDCAETKQSLLRNGLLRPVMTPSPF